MMFPETKQAKQPLAAYLLYSYIAHVIGKTACCS